MRNLNREAPPDPMIPRLEMNLRAFPARELAASSLFRNFLTVAALASVFPSGASADPQTDVAAADLHLSANEATIHHSLASGVVVPRVDIYSGFDSDFLVVANCAGCLLYVAAYQYSSAEVFDAVEMEISVDVSSGPIDIAVVHPLSVTHDPIGLALDVLLVDQVTGDVRPERHTFFGRFDADGLFSSSSWEDFLCAREFGHCFSGATGENHINLNLVADETTSAGDLK